LDCAAVGAAGAGAAFDVALATHGGGAISGLPLKLCFPLRSPFSGLGCFGLLAFLGTVQSWRGCALSRRSIAFLIRLSPILPIPGLLVQPAGVGPSRGRSSRRRIAIFCRLLVLLLALLARRYNAVIQKIFPMPSIVSAAVDVESIQLAAIQTSPWVFGHLPHSHSDTTRRDSDGL
jgi:hypothetical protein